MSSDTKVGAIVTGLYRRSPSLHFDLDYYVSSHIPFTTKLWAPHGLLKAHVLELRPDSGFAIKVILEWKDEESWDAALKDEETKKIMDDIKNFTNAEPLFIVGKVVG
jgi:hypothetical protein